VDGNIVLGPGYRLFESELPVGGQVDDVEELWAAPISKLYIQHPDLGDDELAQAASAAAGGLVSAVMSGMDIVELLPLGLSKARGLSLAARRLGLTAADTVAFGDMPNDLPMFEWAGYGVAMGNAHDLLKAAADEVTASNGEDGIALVLERLFPGA
jgi:Cof subfamily protein (haloacid dehalogenase superfamily)